MSNVNVITESGDIISVEEHNERVAAAERRAAEKAGLTVDQMQMARNLGMPLAEYKAFAGMKNVKDYEAHRRAKADA